jgi:colicin import membrane protein
MSEQKESSVLFSLKELMNLEEDRIKTEEAAQAASAAAAEKARLDAERTARDAEEARIRAEDERRRLDEQRGREEAARLEAIRHAEIEKARLEAEQKARLEAMAAQQHHERSLAAIQQDEGKKKLRNMLIAGIAVVVVGGSVATFLGVKASNEAQARATADAQARAQLEEENKKFQAAIAEQQKKTDSLLSQLSNAKDEATKLALQKQLEEERAKTESIKKGSGGPGRPASPGDAAPKKKCTPGDPLCTDI